MNFLRSVQIPSIIQGCFNAARKPMNTIHTGGMLASWEGNPRFPEMETFERPPKKEPDNDLLSKHLPPTDIDMDDEEEEINILETGLKTRSKSADPEPNAKWTDIDTDER